MLIFLASTACAHASGTVAFFGLYLNDTSSQTTAASALSPAEADPAELARVDMLETLVEQRFKEAGYEFLDLTPVAADLDRVKNPANCYVCDVRMAKKLEADFILVGEIHKVSDALLSVNLQLRDGQSGELVKAGSTSIRGNTDDMWARSMRYILKNRIFREETK